MKKIYLLSISMFLLVISAFSQISSTVVGGNWSSPATWQGGVVPSAGTSVTIVAGSNVTINVAAVAASVTVNGTLIYEATTARSLAVGGDVTISNTGTFSSALSGTQTAHTLTVAGNLTNNGILDFSTNSNTAGAGITFTGNTNNTFGGTGTLTDVSAITINKGTSITPVLELTTSNFSFLGVTTSLGTNPGFLTLVNGTFKISGSFTMTNPVFATTGGYTIPTTAAIWLNNANFTVAAEAGTAQVNGKLQISAGVYNIGTADAERLGYQTGSQVVINGGTINLASRMSPTSTLGLQYTQTAGTFNVNTVASSSGARASFDIPGGDGSSFTMSGGLIVIQNAGTGGGPQDYQNYADTRTITGGTVQFGNVFSGAAKTFFAQGYAPSLVVSNSSAGHTVQLLGNLDVALNTTINPTSTLRLDNGSGTGYVYTQRGATFTNAGTLTGNVAGSDLLFTGTVPQTFNGDGVVTVPLATLELFNGQGLSIANTIASDLVTSNLIMNFGNITTGVTTLTLGTSTAAPGTFTYAGGTIVGKFKRWITESAGNRNFPVGTAVDLRTASINFTTAPATGGTLTTEWVNAPGGSNGLPLTQGAINVNVTAQQGYWSVVAANGLTGGVYTGTFTATNIVTINDYTQLVLVKRANSSSPWTLNGVHVTTTGNNTIPVLQRTGMVGFSEFGVGADIALNPLPIKIEFFSGNKQGSSNLLTWKVTCTNTPSVNITLERSSDARDFKSISSLTATAVRCLQDFNYTDANTLSGTNYYRLKVIDIDGKITYSPIIALLNKDKGFEIVSLMPNVISTTTLLNVSSAKAAKMTLVVTDINGKQVNRQVVNLAAGSNSVPLNFAGLTSGSYQLTGYAEDGQQKTVRFIKQ